MKVLFFSKKGLILYKNFQKIVIGFRWMIYAQFPPDIDLICGLVLMFLCGLLSVSNDTDCS